MKSPVFADTGFSDLHSALSGLSPCSPRSIFCWVSTSRAGYIICRPCAKWTYGTLSRTTKSISPSCGPATSIHSGWTPLPPRDSNLGPGCTKDPGRISSRISRGPYWATHPMHHGAASLGKGWPLPCPTEIPWDTQPTLPTPTPRPPMGLRVTAKREHSPILATWPGHHSPGEGGSRLGAGREGEARWGRVPEGRNRQLRSQPEEAGRQRELQTPDTLSIVHCPSFTQTQGQITNPKIKLLRISRQWLQSLKPQAQDFSEQRVLFNCVGHSPM